ncbi:unnamed protein product [Pleuronectes platessa]|uniref:Uncharacterized protein n=1 Tax=Pleuronectes platessa TaxID=8262 RepID=A0A9N7Z9U8_PLEPL|nr:unnamed protein product [Pleuronectes platessa]
MTAGDGGAGEGGRRRGERWIWAMRKVFWSPEASGSHQGDDGENSDLTLIRGKTKLKRKHEEACLAHGFKVNVRILSRVRFPAHASALQEHDAVLTSGGHLHTELNYMLGHMHLMQRHLQPGHIHQSVPNWGRRACACSLAGVVLQLCLQTLDLSNCFRFHVLQPARSEILFFFFF